MRPLKRREIEALRKISARAVLERAQEILGSLVHPMEKKLDLYQDVPSHAISPEIDLEATLESDNAGEIYMEYQVPRRQTLILTVDTSLSMTGEKLALTAVALAVVILQFPEDRIGIVAFENEANVLKRPDERITIETLVERFLDVPAQGYTHLEDGLKATLKLLRGEHGRRPPSVVLLTDGKYTAGRDPAYLAQKFKHLLVLKMGEERASHDLCKELAHKGHGSLKEVYDLNQLPGVMYKVVKDLLRGRSV